VDPFAEHENKKPMDEDGDCKFFSSANATRLSDPELYRLLRPNDCREIAKALSEFLGVLVTRIQSGCYVGSGPYITCSTEAEADKVVVLFKTYDPKAYRAGNTAYHSTTNCYSYKNPPVRLSIQQFIDCVMAKLDGRDEIGPPPDEVKERD